MRRPPATLFDRVWQDDGPIVAVKPHITLVAGLLGGGIKRAVTPEVAASSPVAPVPTQSAKPRPAQRRNALGRRRRQTRYDGASRASAGKR
jgi:hypothetical protein